MAEPTRADFPELNALLTEIDRLDPAPRFGALCCALRDELPSWGVTADRLFGDERDGRVMVVAQELGQLIVNNGDEETKWHSDLMTVARTGETVAAWMPNVLNSSLSDLAAARLRALEALGLDAALGSGLLVGSRAEAAVPTLQTMRDARGEQALQAARLARESARSTLSPAVIPAEPAATRLYELRWADSGLPIVRVVNPGEDSGYLRRSLPPSRAGRPNLRELLFNGSGITKDDWPTPHLALAMSVLEDLGLPEWDARPLLFVGDEPTELLSVFLEVVAMATARPMGPIRLSGAKIAELINNPPDRSLTGPLEAYDVIDSSGGLPGQST